MALRQTTELLIILAFSIQIILGQNPKPRYYCFPGVKMTYYSWRDFCKARGQELVMPTSLALVHQIRHHCGINKYFWIGAIRHSRYQFLYHNGEAVVSSLWEHHEPNNSGGHENCVEYGKSGFNDVRCNVRNMEAVCQDKVKVSTDDMEWSRSWSSWS